MEEGGVQLAAEQEAPVRVVLLALWSGPPEADQAVGKLLVESKPLSGRLNQLVVVAVGEVVWRQVIVFRQYSVCGIRGHSIVKSYIVLTPGNSGFHSGIPYGDTGIPENTYGTLLSE